MKIHVAPAPGKGRGIFAKEMIARGEIIESAPVVDFSEEEWKQIEKTKFTYYCFFWGEEYKAGAMVLGYGSLYNHSFNANAEYLRRTEEKMMDFVAIRDIAPGEEITINYNGDPDDATPFDWFDVVE